MIRKGVPSDLRENEIPPTVEEAVSRMNAVLMVSAVSEVLEDERDEGEDITTYYRDLMNRIQYLLRGYDFYGKPIPNVKETSKRTEP